MLFYLICHRNIDSLIAQGDTITLLLDTSFMPEIIPIVPGIEIARLIGKSNYLCGRLVKGAMMKCSGGRNKNSIHHIYLLRQ